MLRRVGRVRRRRLARCCVTECGSSYFPRGVRKAAKTSGIPKPVTCHTLRRSFATQMLRAGYDARSVQKLMGHNDVRTTMIYVEAITDAGIGIAVRSPPDRPEGRAWTANAPGAIRLRDAQSNPSCPDRRGRGDTGPSVDR